MIALLNELAVDHQRVLLRVDFNLPMHQGKILDTARIQAVLPTLHYLLQKQAKIVIISHLGNPEGRDPSLSLAPVVPLLEDLLQHTVTFLNDCMGPEVVQASQELLPQQILFLENLRFHPAETNPSLDPTFGKNLALLGDIYVNDAFGASHRSHSSITETPRYFTKKSMGLLMQREYQALQQLLSPQRPFCALIGGKKISSKLAVLEALLHQVDTLLLGGAMVFTFLQAKGIPIGTSYFEPEMVPTAHTLLEKGKGKLVLAVDFVTEANKITPSLSPKDKGADIGPKTIELFSYYLENAKTIFWNGPLGIYEEPPFDQGTLAIARSCAATQAYSVVGGGDSIAAIQRSQVSECFSHLSTGGGASLAFIEKGTLPGIEALK